MMTAEERRRRAAEGLVLALLASDPQRPTSATGRIKRSAIAALEPTGVDSVSRWLDRSLYGWLIDHLTAAIAPHLALLSDAAEDVALPEDMRAQFRVRLAELDPVERAGAWVWVKRGHVLDGILDAAGVALAGQIAERMNRGSLPVPSVN